MKNLKHLQRFKGNPKKNQGGWVAIAGLVLAAVGTAVSYDQGQQASSAREEQNRANERARQASDRAANVRAQQERVKVAREARIARAQLLSGATTGGLAPTSSGVAGGISSISSQEGANVGAINVAQSFAQQASLANQQSATAGSDIANAQATAAQWQSLSSFGGSIFKLKSGTPVQGAKASGTMSADEFMNPRQIKIG